MAEEIHVNTAQMMMMMGRITEPSNLCIPISIMKSPDRLGGFFDLAHTNFVFIH